MRRIAWTIVALVMLSAGPAAAQSCTTDANGLHISCGMLSGNRVGNITFWSDGTSTTHVGNVSSQSDGETSALKSNAPLMGSGRFNQNSDTTSSNGRSCRHVGVTSFCE